MRAVEKISAVRECTVSDVQSLIVENLRTLIIRPDQNQYCGWNP